MVWSKRVTGMRVMVYVDRKCKTIENVSLQSSHVEKREDNQDNFKQAEGANPANCGLLRAG